MFTRALCAVAILLFAVSCTKDETTALPDPPQVESPLLITKRTFETTLADGQQVIDSFAYEYDDKGQIIKHTNLKLGSFVTLQYADDVVDRLTHYNGRGEKVLTQINVMKRVEDGNTILWDLSGKGSNGGIDTILYYYTFKDRQIQSIRGYWHEEFANAPFEELISYTYDAQGNLLFIDKESGGSKTRFTITGNDGKKNPYRLLSLSNLIYMAGNIFYTMGNTNPLKLEAPGFGPQIFTWTYNEEGYPLTMKTGTGFQVSYEYTKR